MERSHASQHDTSTAVDTEQLAREMTEQFRQVLSTKRMNALTATHSAKSRSSSPAPRDFGTPQSPSPSNFGAPPSYSSLRNIPIEPQPPQDARSMRFKHMLQVLSQMPIKWENPGLLDEALRVIPLEQIYNEAEEESQVLQAEAESLGTGKKPAWGYQDCVVRALLRWFKRTFFTWVNNPECSLCFRPTIAIGMAAPLPDEQARGANQVELYQCSNCAAYERFPRYTDAFVLLTTRKGRCGEWTNCFGMLCRAVGSRVRWVWNSEDHVWIEVYSLHRKRWVHVDACEEAWDKPRLYAEGWGKKMAYCIGFSVDGAVDITRRYVRNPTRFGLERNRAPEAVLAYILQEIRTMRRANMTKQEKFRLQGEDLAEETELRNCYISAIATEVSRISAEDLLNGNVNSRARSDPDAQKALEGRSSGSADWIRNRGEDGRSTAPNQQDPHDRHSRS